MFNSIDLVNEVCQGRLTEDEADDIVAEPWTVLNDYEKMSYDELLKALGLSEDEHKAISCGVYFETLGSWRVTGWPTKCAVCDRPIDYDQSDWGIADNSEGDDTIVHLRCIKREEIPVPDVSGLTRFLHFDIAASDVPVRYRALALNCHDHLKSLKWCKSINESYFALGVLNSTAVCVFDIEPWDDNDYVKSMPIEKYVWVVSSPLATGHFPNCLCQDAPSAVEEYVFHMNRWIESIRESKDTSWLFPTLEFSPTLEWALKQEVEIRKLSTFLSEHYPDVVSRKLDT